jgi:hypothetical protein
MDRTAYADADYRQPHVPPATPPVIDANADAAEAATLAMDDGDSDAPGSQPAHFNRSREDEVAFDHGNEGHLLSGQGGDRDYPGQQPDEIVPGQGDTEVPERTPDEVAPDQGDFDRPDSSPIESPPQPDFAPPETPASPD